MTTITFAVKRNEIMILEFENILRQVTSEVNKATIRSCQTHETHPQSLLAK